MDSSKGQGIIPKAIDFFLNARPDDKNDINFLLYCASSNKYEFTELIVGMNKSGLKQAGFDARKKTKVLIHGFYSHAFAEFPRNIKDAYLKTYENDCNVICVNWSPLSGLINTLEENLERVIAAISKFLLGLVDLDISKVHLVGHAIGAHICGRVAAAVKENGKKNIGRITALDASCTCFDHSTIDRSVQEIGADFVDAYYTGSLINTVNPASILLFRSRRVDFLIKGGKQQVKSDSDGGVAACVHKEAHEIFCRTILDKPQEIIVANLCSTAKKSQVSASSSTPKPIILGEHCSPGTTGVFLIDYPINIKMPRDSGTNKSKPSKKNVKPNPPAGRPQ